MLTSTTLKCIGHQLGYYSLYLCHLPDDLLLLVRLFIFFVFLLVCVFFSCTSALVTSRPWTRIWNNAWDFDVCGSFFVLHLVI